MKPGISGYVCVRNAILYDYCVVEAIRSLIPICDEVVVCDGQSEDKTVEMIHGIGDSRIRVIEYPWPNPKGNDRFWVEWINWARVRLNFSYQITVDADEVLDPASYQPVIALAEMDKCGIFERLNFWKNAQHLAPKNTVCGDTVARCGPTYLYMPSDEPYPAISPNVREQAQQYPDLRIFHYGFLREPNAFVRKSKAVQTMFMGSCDQRLLEMEAANRPWTERDYFNGTALDRFNGRHPEVANHWLSARGYEA